mmetsp:Transcript_2895/g.8544  ORF Transcript_2895/g.8544 Transcript_2895/m.8544 type:complete len:597 (-) Transcript_2895:257-2047(-)|eukprot:CAMPEP_0206042286 /NCGR_PEP_ID=MMETSP1466-20131121/6463_1 /ASSEMBLY_ACC=CAM_ASM_001126 /TAXON_ID=44452 /ORGANISM="Pavlova gyrans, Strain CCMP608" /LENGTH=596 /DNA_ID=CAMNT_0053416995 /DNA_START=11 /DNA_END=1801 /DNA_ORIENTATION=+
MTARRAAFEIDDDDDDANSQDQLTGNRSHAGVGRKDAAPGGLIARLHRQPLLVLMATCIIVATAIFIRGGQGGFTDPNSLKFVTWNIAAINNNPFEYWITHEDAEYKELMKDVQGFIDSPGAEDIVLSTVLTPAMVDELKALMKNEGWGGVDDAVTYFSRTYGSRPIISGFMRDGDLGKKRLVSMPDRITNTINVKGGKVANRPTVINCYSKFFVDEAGWWTQWKDFMFKHQLSLANGKTARPAELLGPIPRIKYPALTVEEETISKPLSIICQAAFDAILVHMLNSAAGGKHALKWQPLRKAMCDALNSKKNARTVAILSAPAYRDADVIFLQEVAGAFVQSLRVSALGSVYEIFVSSTSDGKRDQNSAILLRKSRFDTSSVREHTAAFDAMIGKSGKDVPVAPGDVVVLSARDRVTTGKGATGVPFLLASFHGDTNGLATIPVVTAMRELARSPDLADHELVFGLDANTYERGSSSKQGVLEFANAYGKLGLTSCWGDRPDPTNHTTFNARTYLQPQLNKAVKLSDMDKPGVGDKNPKDFILFPQNTFTIAMTVKDNTGEGRYVEKMVFPTLQFPSDHGILSTVVRFAGEGGSQ